MFGPSHQLPNLALDWAGIGLRLAPKGAALEEAAEVSCISCCSSPRAAPGNGVVAFLPHVINASRFLRRNQTCAFEALLRRLILVKSTVGMTLAGLARVLSLLEKRMQSVLRIKQISPLRVSLVAPLRWPLSARSVSLRQACRTESMRRRTMMRGVWLLRRLFRVAHRSRRRRRRTAENRRTVSDGISQDWEKK